VFGYRFARSHCFRGLARIFRPFAPGGPRAADNQRGNPTNAGDPSCGLWLRLIPKKKNGRSAPTPAMGCAKKQAKPLLRVNAVRVLMQGVVVGVRLGAGLCGLGVFGGAIRETGTYFQLCRIVPLFFWGKNLGAAELTPNGNPGKNRVGEPHPVTASFCERLQGNIAWRGGGAGHGLPNYVYPRGFAHSLFNTIATVHPNSL